MAEPAVKCPVCAATLKGKSEAELVRMLREHARHEHSLDLPEDKAKQLVKMENVGKKQTHPPGGKTTGD